jgi:hypothetical protein
VLFSLVVVSWVGVLCVYMVVMVCIWLLRKTSVAYSSAVAVTLGVIGKLPLPPLQHPLQLLYITNLLLRLHITHLLPPPLLLHLH